MGRSRAVSVMLWALSENENAPNNRQIFRIRTEPSESIVSTSRLDAPCDLMWGLPCLAARRNLGGMPTNNAHTMPNIAWLKIPGELSTAQASRGAVRASAAWRRGTAG